jgi:hypothetical protein
MPSGVIQNPTWLRQMESILEELNEGVIIIDDQLRVIFALIRLGRYERREMQGHTPDAIFPREDLPYIMRQHELGQHYGRHRNEFYFPRKDERAGASSSTARRGSEPYTARRHWVKAIRGLPDGGRSGSSGWPPLRAVPAPGRAQDQPLRVDEVCRLLQSRPLTSGHQRFLILSSLK